MAGELKRLEEEYTNKVRKYHDRYQGLLDAHITVKQAHADLTQHNLEHGRLKSCCEAQDEALTEVLSFLRSARMQQAERRGGTARPARRTVGQGEEEEGWITGCHSTGRYRLRR